MLFFSLTFLWSICLINVVFHSNKDISDIPFLMCQVLIQWPMPLTILVLAFKISLLFSLNFGPLQKILCNLFSEIIQRLSVALCPWPLSTYCDHLPVHCKLSVFSKIASTLNQRRRDWIFYYAECSSDYRQQ